MTSTIKVNNIQNQCGANIINENSNTITIGASGDTIALASGASQSGFGRSGSVNWQTGSIKTSTFTAANGEGYFCNTSGGAFTVNLPVGSAGAIVSVSDYTRTFQTNNLTVAPNGSEKIGGIAADAILVTEGQTATFVYVDATEGWINTQETSNSLTGKTFVTATGGTIATVCTNFKVHTFTGPGTFCVSQIASCSEDNVVSYTVVAGGGGGMGGGAGAGGFREVNSPSAPFTASPLNGYCTPGNRVTITASAFPITVGAGGAGAGTGGDPPSGSAGTNSVFSTITSTRGGRGGRWGNTGFPNSDVNGGSGGGGGQRDPSGGGVGTGNTPPVSPAQGTNGGSSPADGSECGAAGGGGGATAAGTNGTPGQAGAGGVGATNTITGSPVARAGGGGGGGRIPGASSGAGSPCGTGGAGARSCSPAGSNGTTNTGGGGGGGGYQSCYGVGGNGGSGVVIIRYRFQ
jgi:hypothetical protein